MSDFNELLGELYCHTTKSVEPRIDGTMTVTPMLHMDDELWEQNAVEHDAIGGHIPDVPVLRDSRYYDGTAKQVLITTWNGHVPELQKIVDSINAEADAIRRQLGSLRQQASTYRQNFRMLLNAQMQLLDESGLGRERERAEEPPTARMAAMPRINLTENRQEAAESKKGLQDQPLTSAARRIVPIPQEDE